MERGEKVNMMVRKADNLRTESKMFYKTVNLYNTEQNSKRNYKEI